MIDEIATKDWLFRCEVLRSVRKWEWPRRGRDVPSPWNAESEILSVQCEPMYRISIEAKISDGAHGEDVYKRAMNLFHDIRASSEFYGVTEVPWRNVYERSCSSDGDVRMEFVEPEVSELERILRPVVARQVSRLWGAMTEEIKEAAESDCKRYRLLQETVRIFIFEKIARITYRHGGKEHVCLANLGSRRIFIKGLDDAISDCSLNDTRPKNFWRFLRFASR